jgi:hypothetical protein
MFQDFVLNKKVHYVQQEVAGFKPHLAKKFDLIITTSFTSYDFEKTTTHILFIYRFSID